MEGVLEIQKVNSVNMKPYLKRLTWFYLLLLVVTMFALFALSFFISAKYIPNGSAVWVNYVIIMAVSAFVGERFIKQEQRVMTKQERKRFGLKGSIRITIIQGIITVLFLATTILAGKLTVGPAIVIALISVLITIGVSYLAIRLGLKTVARAHERRMNKSKVGMPSQH